MIETTKASSSALPDDFREDSPLEEVRGDGLVGGDLRVRSENSSLPSEEIDRLSTRMVEALKTVYDPEIPVDIYELGLIYRVDVDDDRNVAVEMTLTAPGCPVAGEMPIWVRDAVAKIEGVGSVDVSLVFDPPWDPSLMSDEARIALDMW